VDLEYVLKWMVGLSSLFALALQLNRPRANNRGWVVVLGALLGLLGLGVALRIDGTGYVLGLLWLSFVGLPTFALRRQLELLEQNQSSRAARWARITAWVHPFDGLPERARFVAARSLMDEGEVAQARELLLALTETEELGELARLEAWRLDGQWRQIVEYIEAQPVGQRDLRLAPLYMQALGETGDISNMLAWFGKLPGPLRRYRRLLQQTAAYAGRPELLRELSLHGSNTRLVPLDSYWAAIAEQASGNTAGARPLLEAAAQHPTTARLAVRRIRRPLEPVRPADLSKPARVAMALLESQVRAMRAELPARVARPWLTWALSAVLLIVFAIGRGTTDQTRLIDMGALVLPAELLPDSWRLVSAGFLHLGATHLGMNILALLFLGGVVERLWGKAVFLMCFFAASVGAYWLATLTVEATLAEPKVLLGASAGVFGLVGALSAFEVVASWFGHTPLFNRRLLALAVLVLAQLVFDWFTPIVSSFLHLAGVGFGALMALPFAIRYWHPARAR